MTNYIDLSNLPICSRGIDWKNSYGKIVNFSYRNNNGFLTILDCPDIDRINIDYNSNIFTLTKESLKRCCLGKLFGFSVTGNYKYNVGDIISDNDSPLLVIKQIRIGKRSVKGYQVRCLTCGHEFSVRECNIDKGDRCPACSNHVVVIGKTDLWTTAPNIARFLSNPEDGFVVVKNSNKQLDFTCPECGFHIGKKIVYDVSTRGISCPNCGDGISYPNKFLRNLLNQLEIEYKSEVVFDWCVFPAFNNCKNFCYGIYDCCIPSRKTLIEMDGGLGHGKVIHSKSKITKEETIYRDQKKEELANKNGYKIIRINCVYMGHDNKFDICKNAILNSELSLLYNLSNIDWEDIDLRCQKSIIYEIANLWNKGLSSGEISEMLKISLGTTIDYLHKCNILNLCNYTPYKRRRK